MKALTLWRPWSDAVVRGPKRVENRTWLPPYSALGTRIALHAGRRYHLSDSLWPEGFEPPPESPLGIVGIARVVGYLDRRNGKHRSESAVLVSDPDYPKTAARLHQLHEDPWWAGPVGWLFDQVVALDVPIEARGRQGLWAVPPAIVREIERQTRVRCG